jgi:hypothetical protein
MKEKELFEKYPEAFKIIKEWYIAKMYENSRDTPEEFIEAIKDRIDGMIFSVADKNPSFFFSLFDENDIFIFTNMLDGNLFGYKIFTGTSISKDSPLMLISDDNFPVRKCAEKAAIIEAVKLLNEKHQKD